MMKLKARGRSSRLVLGEPAERVVAEEGDELDLDDRARLHASLRRSAEQLGAGRGIDATEALARLQRR